MPKSKRSKQVDLTKTKKHGMEGKKHLYEQIRQHVDSYKNIFIFSVNDMRNSKMQTVRMHWRHSRFCIGKSKVMALALGRTEEEEYRTNLHKIAQRLKGERGLFFTNEPTEEVLKWFLSYSEADVARSGNTATEDVHLKEGPMSEFPHNLEPYLRQLGLPTALQKGVIHLVKDHVVCNQGDTLSPETARILKLLGYEMAEFSIKMECVWSQDGSFENFISDSAEGKENIQEQTVSIKPSDSTKDVKVADAEQDMEVENTDDQEEEKAGCALDEFWSGTLDTAMRKFDKSWDGRPIDEHEIAVPDPSMAAIPGNSSQKENQESKIDKSSENADEAPPTERKIMELTKSKLEEVTPKPKKFSPKMTRARAVATNTRIKTPESLENIKRSARKAPKETNM